MKLYSVSYESRCRVHPRSSTSTTPCASCKLNGVNLDLECPATAPLGSALVQRPLKRQVHEVTEVYEAFEHRFKCTCDAKLIWWKHMHSSNNVPCIHHRYCTAPFNACWESVSASWKIVGLKTKDIAVPTGIPCGLPKKEKKTQKKHKNTKKKYRQRHVYMSWQRKREREIERERERERKREIERATCVSDRMKRIWYVGLLNNTNVCWKSLT